MAGFLRKKKQDSVPTQAAIHTPSSPVNDPPATPLFARFASSMVDAPAQRVVSSPMALASGPRRDQAPRMTNGGGVKGAHQRQDAKQTRNAVEPSYVQGNPAGPSNPAASSASSGNAYAYSSPAQKRLSSAPIRNQTLPAPATTPNVANRRLSQIPGADKPLPAINPSDNLPDPLGSTPPQSTLPANRRASARGMPPQTSVATQNLPNGYVMAAPGQQPHISPPTKSLSNASHSLGTRTLPPPSGQARPKPTAGSSPIHYTKEHGRQDLRHKLSDAGTASGASPAITVPASPPRQGATPGQWGPDIRDTTASSSYQVTYFPAPFSSFHFRPLCMDPVIAS
ncbi:hypothetical protein C8R43DRAFT_11617 [Mycena crocata]|nr:hypothetical protein C8R43DRAFT_11617 [Mycena crocata]